MGRSLQDVLSSLPEKRQQEILKRSRELAIEVQALQQLRKRLDVSQQQMAEQLDVSQPAISQLERQGDITLSPRRNDVEALGGTLKIRVNLPGQSAIALSELANLSESDCPNTSHHLPRHLLPCSQRHQPRFRQRQLIWNPPVLLHQRNLLTVAR